ncbi:hypothetical protein NMY22_g11664 [Coprinellus aureogranulatus]|nr:hypothetical protein NMY22_g11664 [Coprinellus aureogranulatus]
MANSEDALKELAKVFADNGTCGICLAFMTDPYVTIECGHAYCLGCLRVWFDNQLERRLAPYAGVEHRFLRHSVVVCQRVPKSHAERIALRAAMEEHRYDWLNLFKYTCPECRKTVKAPPVRDYRLQGVLNGAVPVLGDLLQERLATNIYTPRDPSKPFEGLFIYNTIANVGSELHALLEGVSRRTPDPMAIRSSLNIGILLASKVIDGIGEPGRPQAVKAVKTYSPEKITSPGSGQDAVSEAI